MTTARTFETSETTQSDLIRHLGPVDTFVTDVKAHHEHAHPVSEMIGSSVAWLWGHTVHRSETKSPPVPLYIESHVQF